MYKYNLKADVRYGDKKLKIENGSKEYLLLSERGSDKRKSLNELNGAKNLSASQSQEHLNLNVILSCFLQTEYNKLSNCNLAAIAFINIKNFLNMNWLITKE